ncbi:hypothetical protein HN419_05165 [Candidatus Woesearchaeota archaeon]|jgi:predicted metal-dependent phosphoesterase TrpH|nr:hypothetical protein [Candidatus Woesearchaeota archaeon]MBT3537739.1 hypothetical protein [Candidatus Woesearchaeota archaeon]MBT4697870.1 hypothetical protein [Candidatus Woesearchaeota archaeon]MBT4717470.1 hypothetical protein [Candidatus Woesearchaeota archaeon]MBT7105408.1 hypothetical protein [Candidatus Woesearchaeota archaeon]
MKKRIKRIRDDRKRKKEIRNKVVNREDGFIYADMHSHTIYSDGLNTLNQVKETIDNLGINIAVTDHNEIKGSLMLSKLKNYKDKIIPGIEVTAKERCHILFYFHDFGSLKSFYEKEVKKFRYKDPVLATTRSAEDLVDLKDKYNAILCLPHPYSPFSGGIMSKIHRGKVDHSILRKFDWIEAINAMQTVNENILSKRLASHLKKPKTAGSDSHDVKTLGKALAYGKAHDLESFYKVISKQRNEIAGVHLSNIRKAVMGAKMATTHVKTLGPMINYYYRDAREELDYYGQLFEHVIKHRIKKIERKVFEK